MTPHPHREGGRSAHPAALPEGHTVMRTIPTDSTDAREQREREAAQVDAQAAEERRHAAKCRGGWLGEDAEGRPVPCDRCRPHLDRIACRTCSTRPEACAQQRNTHRGPCCPDCDHTRTPRPKDVDRRPMDHPRPVPRPPTHRYDLPARIAGGPDWRTDTVLVLITDPDLGEVAVRWRVPPHPAAWAWRCTACDTTTTVAECAHTFAAGVHLARELLGLTTVGIVPPPSATDSRTDTHR